MLPIPASSAVYLAYVTAAFLVLLGVVFAISPSRGLAMTKHRAENLPTIMAGRYFFMVLVAVGIAITLRHGTSAGVEGCGAVTPALVRRGSWRHNRAQSAWRNLRLRPNLPFPMMRQRGRQGA